MNLAIKNSKYYSIAIAAQFMILTSVRMSKIKKNIISGHTVTFWEFKTFYGDKIFKNDFFSVDVRDECYHILIRNLFLEWNLIKVGNQNIKDCETWMTCDFPASMDQCMGR